MITINTNPALYYPAESHKFAARYIFNGSSHPAITRQTTKADVDFATNILDIDIEMPLGEVETLEDLVQLTSTKSAAFSKSKPNINDACVVIDYLNGVDMVPEHSIHCFIDDFISCKFSNDYKSSKAISINLKCNVRLFMITKPSEEQKTETAP